MADNGSGNFGGNGSVWWQVNHGRAGGASRPLTLIPSVPSTPPGGDWVKAKNDDSDVVGHDPVAPQNAGGPGHQGKFRVTLRYTADPAVANPTLMAKLQPAGTGAGSSRPAPAAVSAAMRAAAIQDLEQVIANATAAISLLQSGQLSVSLVADVPVLSRSAYTDNPPWEVKVDW